MKGEQVGFRDLEHMPEVGDVRYSTVVAFALLSSHPGVPGSHLIATNNQVLFETVAATSKVMEPHQNIQCSKKNAGKKKLTKKILWLMCSGCGTAENNTPFNKKDEILNPANCLSLKF